MIDLTPAFGPGIRNRATWDPVIVIRHGILSSQAPFQLLANWLQSRFPNADVDNRSYPWQDSILLNGARLADHILQNYAQGRELVLIGHSMGGLVCRVAACFLSGNAFQSASALANGYTRSDVLAISSLALNPRAIHGLVTLATPNSGAMLHGQVSGLAALVKRVINSVHEGIKDLTTDRLFRILQGYSVNTKVLSISGSDFNRFSQVSGQLSNWLKRGGLRLDLPHDRVVEDRSVDLRQSILPHELHQGASTYYHLRAYENCTDITHTNIYDDPIVQLYVEDFLVRC
jgi:hypothetical protein